MAQQLKWRLGTVIEIRQETPNVKSLILDVPEWTRHLAGQRVDVRLTAEDDYQAQRSYSIASPPEDKSLMLTVERIEDGEVSPYLTDELRVGDGLELRGPIGGWLAWDANQGGRVLAAPGAAGRGRGGAGGGWGGGGRSGVGSRGKPTRAVPCSSWPGGQG